MIGGDEAPVRFFAAVGRLVREVAERAAREVLAEHLQVCGVVRDEPRRSTSAIPLRDLEQIAQALARGEDLWTLAAEYGYPPLALRRALAAYRAMIDQSA